MWQDGDSVGGGVMKCEHLQTEIWVWVWMSVWVQVRIHEQLRVLLRVAVGVGEVWAQVWATHPLVFRRSGPALGVDDKDDG